MSFGEIILTLAVTLCVLRPAELKQTAYSLGKIIQFFTEQKTALTTQWQEYQNTLQLEDNEKRAREADKRYQGQKE